MKTIKKGIAWGLLVLASAMLMPTPAAAADMNTYLLQRALGLTVTRHVTASTTKGSTAFRLKWLGAASAGATVAIAAGGDMAFTTDGTTADTTVSTDGTIDLSTPAASENTIGEVIDVINASGAGHWQAIPVDCLPSQSSDNTLVTLAETSTSTGVSATYAIDAKGLFDPEGLAISFDIAVTTEITCNIGPENFQNELLSTSNLLNRQTHPQTGSDWAAELYKVVANGTFSAGSATLEVWLVKPNGLLSAGSYEEKLWTQTGAATTVDNSLDNTDLPPIKVPEGSRILVRYDCGTTATAGDLQVFGLTWQP